MRRSRSRLEMVWDEWLDPDGKGYVRPGRLRHGVEAMFRDRYAISITMQDVQAVVRSMETLFLVFYLLIVALILFGLFSSGQDVGAAFASIASLVVAWSFIFGPSAARSFEGLVFLFGVHQYDVGDTVSFDGDNYTVLRMRILATDFLSAEGGFVRVENDKLRAKLITNLTTSKQYSQLISFHVHANEMTPEVLEGLTEDLTAFVKDNPKDFKSFSVSMREFVHNVTLGGRGDNGNHVRVSIWLDFQKFKNDLRGCHMARQNFIMQICTLLRKYDIGHSLQSDKIKAQLRLMQKDLRAADDADNA